MNEWTEAEARAERAYELYEEGRWAEAAAELRAAIEVNPYNSAWHFNLGLTLEAMEQYEPACQAYQRALELEPEDIEVLNCLGVNLTRLGRYAEALKRFEQIQKLDPGYEPCYCNRIVTYCEMGDHDNAELMFHLARQWVDECPLCYYNIGNSFYARGQYERAIDCWRQTLRLDSHHRQAHARIAETCWLQGDLQTARQHYQAELELDGGQDVDLLLDYGDLLMEMGDLEGAQQKFEAALDGEPDNPEAHYCLGELALRRNQFTVAEAQFRTVLELDPRFPGAHTRLARIMLRQGLRRYAARHLSAELEHCQDDPALLGEVGELLIEAGRIRQANVVFRRLAKINPSDPRVQHNLAVSYLMLDELEAGIRHCRKALRLQPDYPLALYNLALAYMQMGQIPRARRYAARALLASPHDEQVTTLCRQLGVMGTLSRLRMRLTRRSCRDNIRR